MAATMLEEYYDETQLDLECKYQQNSNRHRARFSPGYGDFSIQYQKEILAVLEAGKSIGLSMTDGCMLIPTKSITAIIGIEEGDKVHDIR